MPRPPTAATKALLVLLVLSLGQACLETSPQIAEISPQLNATGVRSNQPIRIRFDREVDRQSVASRFHLSPAAEGAVSWEGGTTMIFQPRGALRAATRYEAALEPGYKDSAGHPAQLRHSWTFTTERAPRLSSSTPASGEQGVDPSTYISLAFDREMDLDSLAQAAGLFPPAALKVAQDPNDRRRAILAPQSLLHPDTTYSLVVGSGAEDVDHNPLAQVRITFRTGPARPLHHQLGFVVQGQDGDDTGGVWMVDENRVPRQIVMASASNFSWSPDGLHLLIQGSGRSWLDQPLAGPPVSLPFEARWAASLGGDRGYVFLRDDQLIRWSAHGGETTMASGVELAALAPDQSRVAFTTTAGDAAEIHALTLDINAEYRLVRESQPISKLAWSPDGGSLAYLVAGTGSTGSLLKVRSLGTSGQTTQLATGQLDGVAWLNDSAHLVVTALVNLGDGPARRAFTISTAGPATLDPDRGLPRAPASLDVETALPSPDGHQIAFLGRRSGLTQPWIMNYDGTHLTQLTSFSAPCSALAWTLS